jgi:predicted nucleotidyltransferase
MNDRSSLKFNEDVKINPMCWLGMDYLWLFMGSRGNNRPDSDSRLVVSLTEKVIRELLRYSKIVKHLKYINTTEKEPWNTGRTTR